jgi:hypothetical protein
MDKLIFIGLICLLVLTSGINSCSEEISQSQNTSLDNKNEMSNMTTPNAKSCLYKETKAFEGYHYCEFSFDYADEEYAKEMEYEFVKFCNLSEKYPLINDFLYNEYSIRLEDGNWQFSAWYKGNGEIGINKAFSRAKNLDIYIAHEIAHSSTENLNLPAWLDEGIAEYSAHHFFGTEAKLNWYGFDGFEKWNPNTASYGDNIKGYIHSGQIIRSFVREYGEEKFKALLERLDCKINYDDDINTKNQKVLEAFREILNNESLSLEDITCRYSSGNYCFGD